MLASLPNISSSEIELNRYSIFLILIKCYAVFMFDLLFGDDVVHSLFFFRYKREIISFTTVDSYYL